MRLFLMILALMLHLHAIERSDLIGSWKSVAKSTNNGTHTIEKEYLHLHADRSFSIVILVSLQKGDAFVKDLQIKGSGIWKVHERTLVAVVNKIDVPFAKEVYLISQASLRNLAANFKNRLHQEPIRILEIKHIDSNKLITENETSKQTNYIRQ